MIIGLTAALAIIYGLIYYVVFYVFFPSKEEMTRGEVKNRRYNKIGFFTILTLASFGAALVGDDAYMTPLVFAPMLVILVVLGNYFRKQQAQQGEKP